MANGREDNTDDNGHETHPEDARKARVWAAKERGRRTLRPMEPPLKLFDSRAIKPPRKPNDDR